MLNASTDVGHKILSQLDSDPELVVEFFAVFSRMEYALKRADLWRQRGTDVDAVAPDWFAFARGLNSVYRKAERDLALTDAIEYYVAHPPAQQICEGRVLKWRPVSIAVDAPSLADLLRCVCQVRNNLFHGGKYPELPIDEPSRNDWLLRHGLTILKSCLDLKHPTAEKVRRYFDIPLF